jgi:hypothetical protein
MRALFTFGGEVPLTRVAADHRRWLLPLGIVLGVNVLVLIFVVLPLRQSAASASTRADASAQALRAAMADEKAAEATRDGQVQAAKDLDRFYAGVLPVDLPTARRITHVKFAQLARSHDVNFQGGGTSTEELRQSTLERLHVSYQLTGDWDDIRQLIYDLETSSDFIVIDNVQLTEGNAQNAPLTLALELSTYYRVKASPSADGR